DAYHVFDGADLQLSIARVTAASTSSCRVPFDATNTRLSCRHGSPARSVTVPPAARTIATPPTVSHGLIKPVASATSIDPSATAARVACEQPNQIGRAAWREREGISEVRGAREKRKKQQWISG